MEGGVRWSGSERTGLDEIHSEEESHGDAPNELTKQLACAAGSGEKMPFTRGPLLLSSSG